MLWLSIIKVSEKLFAWPFQWQELTMLETGLSELELSRKLTNTFQVAPRVCKGSISLVIKRKPLYFCSYFLIVSLI